jgi:hypothetical protein
MEQRKTERPSGRLDGQAGFQGKTKEVGNSINKPHGWGEGGWRRGERVRKKGGFAEGAREREVRVQERGERWREGLGVDYGEETWRWGWTGQSEETRLKRKDVLKEIPRIGMALAATAQCPEEQE